jgi:hypothetical protein
LFANKQRIADAPNAVERLLQCSAGMVGGDATSDATSYADLQVRELAAACLGCLTHLADSVVAVLMHQGLMRALERMLDPTAVRALLASPIGADVGAGAGGNVAAAGVVVVGAGVAGGDAGAGAGVGDSMGAKLLIALTDLMKNVVLYPKARSVSSFADVSIFGVEVHDERALCFPFCLVADVHFFDFPRPAV